MKIKLYFIFFICFSVNANQILQVGQGRSDGLVGIANDSLLPWKLHQRVCFSRKEKILTCGEVIKINPNLSIVRVAKGNIFGLVKGDAVKESTDLRDIASESDENNETKEIKTSKHNKNNVGYISPLLGIVLPLTSTVDRSAIFGFGIEAALSVYQTDYEDFNIGISIQSAGKSYTIGGTKEDSTLTVILASFIGRKLFGSPLYAGGRFGVGILSSYVPSLSINGNATSFAVSPVLGAEFGISESIMLGLECSWLSLGGGQMDLNMGGGHLGTVNYNPSSYLNFLLNVKVNL